MAGAIAIFLPAALIGAGHHFTWFTPDAPRDPDALVLRVAFLKSPGSPARRPVPNVSLYGDGRLLTTKTASGGYLSREAIRDQRLTRGAYERFHRDARMAGFAAPRTYEGGSDVRDGALTTVTFLADGRHRTTRIGAGGLRPRLARRLIDRLLDVPPEDLRSPATEYEPERLAVIASRVPPDGALSRSWPLAPLAEPCLLLTGPDARKAAYLASSNRPFGHWQSGPHHYSVSFRPLLPDESRCP